MLLMLLTSSGMFVASTTLLPSTFAMYALTAGGAALMEAQPFVGDYALLLYAASTQHHVGPYHRLIRNPGSS